MRTRAGAARGAVERLSLPRFACGVFGVACGLLVLLVRCIGLGLGDAFGLLTRDLFDGSLCLADFVSRAFRLSLLCSDAVGELPVRGAQLSCCLRFRLCGLLLG